MLARAIAAAGLIVLECEQPSRKARCGKGKSDPIDAHLAVLAALRLDADRLPSPRADGDREALRILLGARQELTTASTAQTNRLRALLLGGDDTDRTFARGLSPRPAWPTWPGAGHRARPAGSRPYGTPRSAASPSPCAKPPARSRPTVSSWRPSSTTSFPG
jgi:Transposase